MITLDRLAARRLRGLFRRRNLDLPPRGPAPPIVLVAEPWTGLRVRHLRGHVAVEFAVLGPRPESPETIVLPFDALADFKGLGPSGLTLETVAPGRTAARWVDQSTPVLREYAVPEPESLPPFPLDPGPLAPGSSDLLDALAEAAGIAREDTPRFALGLIQVRGAGSVVATDGRQLLIRHGLAFPWDDDLLIRSSRLFARPEIPRDRPVSIGRTEAHVVVRAGAVTLWLAIRTGVRYPRVDGIIPDIGPRTARLRLDPGDARLLADALGRLPGGDRGGGPVTLDLNGVVAVRSRGQEDEHPTEVVLERSWYTGEPVRVATDRSYLARALTLGLGEFQVSGPDSVLSGRAGAVTYAWQPLERDAAIAPEEATVQIGPDPAVAVTPATPERSTMSLANPTQAPIIPARCAPDEPTHASSGSISPIEEAEALHAALSEAKARSGRLLVALRRQRRSNRLVAETLRSLEGLRDAAG